MDSLGIEESQRNRQREMHSPAGNIHLGITWENQEVGEGLKKCPGQIAPVHVYRHKSRFTYCLVPVTQSIWPPCRYSNNRSTFSLRQSSCRTWRRALGPVSSALFQRVLREAWLDE